MVKAKNQKTPKNKIKGGKLKTPASPKDDHKGKKPRNNNPGVRVQGGRIYDSENGTTCHQCRQKTVEIKARCNTCTLHFCPRCLHNRYSEDVSEISKLPKWSCPRCRNLCNCSNCRKKQGLDATGILANVAKTAGFGSVSELLRKNPKAQSLHMIQRRCEEGSASPEGSTVNGKIARGPSNTGAAVLKSAKAKPVTAKPVKRKAVPPETALIPDSELGPRTFPMPEVEPLKIHATKPCVLQGAAAAAATATATADGGAAAAGPSVKRQRGPAWASHLAETSVLSFEVDTGSLLAILEFFQVFSSPLKLKGGGMHAAALTAELCQPPAVKRSDLLVPVPEDSMVAAVHVELLGLVRKACGVNSAVGLSNWQGIMQAYYAATQIPNAWSLQREHGPPAVAGELFIRPEDSEEPSTETDDRSYTDQPDDDEEESRAHSDSIEGAECGEEQQVGSAPAPAVDYPPGGYWAVPPKERVAMLHALVHDALDTYPVRQVIEQGMGDALAVDKERKSNLADVRREAKEAATKRREQEIALMIASGDAKGMSLEEQRKMIDAARQRAENATAAANAAKVKALSNAVHPPTVRVTALGADREERMYYTLQCAPAVAGYAEDGGPEKSPGGKKKEGNKEKEKSPPEGKAATSGRPRKQKQQPKPAIVVISPPPSQGQQQQESERVHAVRDVHGVAAALDSKGQKEGPLKHALMAAYAIKETSLPTAASTKITPTKNKHGIKSRVAGVSISPGSAAKKTKKKETEKATPGKSSKNKKVSTPGSTGRKSPAGGKTVGKTQTQTPLQLGAKATKSPRSQKGKAATSPPKPYKHLPPRGTATGGAPAHTTGRKRNGEGAGAAAGHAMVGPFSDESCSSGLPAVLLPQSGAGRKRAKK